MLLYIALVSQINCDTCWNFLHIIMFLNIIFSYCCEGPLYDYLYAVQFHVGGTLSFGHTVINTRVLLWTKYANLSPTGLFQCITFVTEFEGVNWLTHWLTTFWKSHYTCLACPLSECVISHWVELILLQIA